jgi:hypothetical protein
MASSHIVIIRLSNSCIDCIVKLFLFPQKERVTAESTKHQVDMAIQSLKKRTGLAKINNFTLAFTDFKLDDDADDEDEEEGNDTNPTASWPDMTYYHHLWKVNRFNIYTSCNNRLFI